MNTIKLFSAICYDAYMCQERGFHWYKEEPESTRYYKYDNIKEHFFALPNGITAKDCIAVYTEFDNSPLVETVDSVYKLTNEIL